MGKFLQVPANKMPNSRRFERQPRACNTKLALIIHHAATCLQLLMRTVTECSSNSAVCASFSAPGWSWLTKRKTTSICFDRGTRARKNPGSRSVTDSLYRHDLLVHTYEQPDPCLPASRPHVASRPHLGQGPLPFLLSVKKPDLTHHSKRRISESFPTSKLQRPCPRHFLPLRPACGRLRWREALRP